MREKFNHSVFSILLLFPFGALFGIHFGAVVLLGGIVAHFFVFVPHVGHVPDGRGKRNTTDGHHNDILQQQEGKFDDDGNNKSTVGCVRMECLLVLRRVRNSQHERCWWFATIVCLRLAWR